eukprot:116169_1
MDPVLWWTKDKSILPSGGQCKQIIQMDEYRYNMVIQDDYGTSLHEFNGKRFKFLMNLSNMHMKDSYFLNHTQKCIILKRKNKIQIIDIDQKQQTQTIQIPNVGKNSLIISDGGDNIHMIGGKDSNNYIKFDLKSKIQSPMYYTFNVQARNIQCVRAVVTKQKRFAFIFGGYTKWGYDIFDHYHIYRINLKTNNCQMLSCKLPETNDFSVKLLNNEEMIGIFFENNYVYVLKRSSQQIFRTHVKCPKFINGHIVVNSSKYRDELLVFGYAREYEKNEYHLPLTIKYMLLGFGRIFHVRILGANNDWIIEEHNLLNEEQWS